MMRTIFALSYSHTITTLYYLFSALFYKRLVDHPWAARAFILALMDMYELTKDQAIVLLEGIPSEARTEEPRKALRSSQSEFPCRKMYCLGMYQCHSLLPQQEVSR